MEEQIVLQESRWKSISACLANHLDTLVKGYEEERSKLLGEHKQKKCQVEAIMSHVEQEERLCEAEDIADANTQNELMRNQRIEDDHQMKSQLKERIERLRTRHSAAIHGHKARTSNIAQQFKQLFVYENALSRKVHKTLRLVQKIHEAIAYWRHKLSQTRKENLVKNSFLAKEKKQLQLRYNRFKQIINHNRDESSARTANVCCLAKRCSDHLQGRITKADNIIRLAGLCKALETQEERYGNLLAEDGAEENGDKETNGVRNLCCRLNKFSMMRVLLEKEVKRVTQENLRIQKDIDFRNDSLRVVSTSVDDANPLLVINGRSSICP